MTISRFFCSFCILFCVPFLSYSQEIKISGYIKDQSNGEPLIGATVISFKGHNGTSSNSLGFYNISVKRAIGDTLVFSFVGYKQDTMFVNFIQDTTINVSLFAGIDLKEVSVFPDKTHSFGIRKAGLLHIPMSTYKELPSFMERDAIKSLQLLPGIASGLEGQSGLVVRGGGFDQNLFLLDGVPLYHVNHLGNYLSVFEVEALSDIKIFKGAFPASYGSRLSSITDIRIREGNKHSLKGSLSAGLISSSLILEGPIVKGKSSFLISVRRFWPDLVIMPLSSNLLEGATVGYNYFDNIIKVTHELSKNNKLYLSFYAGRDNYKTIFKEKNTSSVTKAYNKQTWGNLLLTGKWVHIYTPDLFGEITAGYTRYSSETSNIYEFSTSVGEYTEDHSIKKLSGVSDLNISGSFEYSPGNNIDLNFGAGSVLHFFDPGSSVYSSNIDGVQLEKDLIKNIKLRALESYIYTDNVFSITNNFALDLGLRWSTYFVEGEFFNSFEPRLSSTIFINDVYSLSVSYNRMQQYLHIISSSGQGIPSDLWMPSTSLIPPQQSSQISFSISRSFTKKGVEISLEGYFKEQSNLSTLKEGVSIFVGRDSWESKIENKGRGMSKGLELLVQKTKGSTTGWVSYTISKTTRKFPGINEGLSYPFKYDRRHDLSFVIKKKISNNIDLAATWIYGSGLPVNLALGKYRTVTTKDYINNSGDIFRFDQDAYIYGSKNSIRMRAYHRLDLGINFHKEKPKGKRTWSFSIYNLYNRQNPLYYYVDYPENESQMKIYQKSLFPIMPSISYLYRFN